MTISLLPHSLQSSQQASYALSRPPEQTVFSFQLDSILKRTAAAGMGVLLCVGLTVGAWRDYQVGRLTDERGEMQMGELQAAASAFPGRASVVARYARAELEAAPDREASVPQAAAAAKRATQLSPHDFRHHLLLSEAAEAAGDQADAEAALRNACRLAPHHAGARWLLGNYLVRQNRFEEALPELRQAAQGNPMYLLPSLELVWNFSNGDAGRLANVAGDGANARLQLARFLLEQGQTGEALKVYEKVERGVRRESGWARDFLQMLIRGGAVAEARSLWLQEVAAPPDLVWNGGFEQEMPTGMSYFLWDLKPSEFARPRLVAGQAYSGQNALKLELSGRDTLRLGGEVGQIIVVKPGAAYRLVCHARAELSQEVEGIHITVSRPEQAAAVAETQDLKSRARAWQRLTVDFVAPLNTSLLVISLRRAPRFSFEEPVRGALWFDDFSLQRPMEAAQARK